MRYLTRYRQRNSVLPDPSGAAGESTVGQDLLKQYGVVTRSRAAQQQEKQQQQQLNNTQRGSVKRSKTEQKTGANKRSRSDPIVSRSHAQCQSTAATAAGTDATAAATAGDVRELVPGSGVLEAERIEAERYDKGYGEVCHRLDNFHAADETMSFCCMQRMYLVSKCCCGSGDVSFCYIFHVRKHTPANSNTRHLLLRVADDPMQTLYKVKWSNTEQRTWEPLSNIALGGDGGRQLLEEWLLKVKQQLAAEQAVADCAKDSKDSAESEVEYSGPMPPADAATQRVSSRGRTARKASDGDATSSGICTKYVDGRFDGRTCGVFQSFDACGYPNAPMDMPGKLCL